MKIDLNFPGFQEDLLQLEKRDLLALIKTLRKCRKMDFQQVINSSGFNVEKIKNLQADQGSTLYSLRVTLSFRATFIMEKDFIRFISLHPDHDSAYKR